MLKRIMLGFAVAATLLRGCGPIPALAAHPDWQDLATQTIVVRLNLYNPGPTGKHRIDGAFRAYIQGADSTLARNSFDLTANASGEWEATAMRNGAKIRSGTYRIREIQGVDSTFVSSELIYAWGLPMGAVDSDTCLADDSVPTRAIIDSAVTEDKLATSAVSTGKIQAGAVGSAELAADLSLTGVTTVEQLMVEAPWSGEFTIASGDMVVTVSCPGLNATDYMIFTGEANEWAHDCGVLSGVSVINMTDDQFQINTSDRSTVSGSDLLGWYLVLKKP